MLQAGAGEQRARGEDGGEGGGGGSRSFVLVILSADRTR